VGDNLSNRYWAVAVADRAIVVVLDNDSAQHIGPLLVYSLYSVSVAMNLVEDSAFVE
jgi:hypothetical protein